MLLSMGSQRVRHNLATKQLVTTDVFPKVQDFIEEER